MLPRERRINSSDFRFLGKELELELRGCYASPKGAGHRQTDKRTYVRTYEERMKAEGKKTKNRLEG